MEETSDDRNGVVVNRPIDMQERSTRTKSTTRDACNRLNKRHPDPSGRREVQHGKNCSSEIHAKSEYVATEAADPILR